MAVTFESKICVFTDCANHVGDIELKEQDCQGWAFTPSDQEIPLTASELRQIADMVDRIKDADEFAGLSKSTGRGGLGD